MEPSELGISTANPLSLVGPNTSGPSLMTRFVAAGPGISMRLVDSNRGILFGASGVRARSNVCTADVTATGQGPVCG